MGREMARGRPWRFLRGVRLVPEDARKPGFPAGDPSVSDGFRDAHICGGEAQRRRFLVLVPKIDRLISRPAAEAAERMNDLNTLLPRTPATAPPTPAAATSPLCDSAFGAGASAAGAGATLASSFSYADSRSTGVPYSCCRADPATIDCCCAGSSCAISDAGGRIRVQATGVGAPL